MISINRISAMLSSLKQTVFAMIFLMSETPPDAPLKSTRAQFVSIVLMVIDFLQVLRTTLPASIGWGPDRAAAVTKVDIVHLVIQTLSPSGVAAACACALLLVFACVCNAAFVFGQIKTDNLDHVLPVRILRVIICITVTTLFPTILELCLKPLTCEFWSSASPCTSSPYAWPHVIVAIISIILSSLLILVACIYSLLFVDIDLLTQEPLASFHGRTASLDIALKISLVLVPLLFTSGVSPVLAIILFVYTAHLSYLTVRILPFMFRATNYIKAAMMFILSYSLFMGVLASFGCDQSQLLTAIYVGYPISALLGITAVYCRCIMLAATADKSLSSLPPELSSDSSAPVPQSPPSQDASKAARWINPRKVLQAAAPNSESPLELKFSVRNKVHRYMREHSESEFYNPEDVIAAAKVLMWQRQRSSVSKIKQLLRASMMQHGENDRITVFALCFVYCIEEDMQRVAGLIESGKHLILGIESQYMKFAISRCLIQRFKTSHSGGMLSAIGLLEVTSVQDEVSKLHRNCLRTLRSFWNAAAQERDVEVLSGFLEEFLVLFQQADFMMKDMLIKYPNSVVFLRAYGAFTRDICQDKIKANELFNKADGLENASDGPEDVGGSKSLSSSTFRSAAVNAWTQNAMQRDIDMMGSVSYSMRNTLILLVTVSTLVYCILEFVLLQSVSGHIADIFALNSARSSCATALYAARDAVLAASLNNAADFKEAIANLIASATAVKAYISNSSFNADTYSFFFFSDYYMLFPQLAGVSLPDQISPASGLQQFADACLIFSATSMSEVARMVAANDFSSNAGSALRFIFMNGDSPVMTSLDNGGMLLQGQAVSFVFLSGVFYVVAGVVVVMLGLHMVVLARRLLSEAIVLMRTSTICISASLHISQISRKFLSAHYKKLDQEAGQMNGEGGLEAADGVDALLLDEHQDAAVDASDVDSDSTVGSDGAVAQEDTGRARLQSSAIEFHALSPEEESEKVLSFLEAAAVAASDVDGPGTTQEAKGGIHPAAVIPTPLDVTAFDLENTVPGTTLQSHTLQSKEGVKRIVGASFADEPQRIPQKSSPSSPHAAVSETGSDNASLHSSQMNLRDRKMMVIVCLSALAVLTFNASCYIYMQPINIGSAKFVSLQLLLHAQAEIDLPLSRMLPTLLHIAQLTNPLLQGQSRTTQTEHLSILKQEFEGSISDWQSYYSDVPALSKALQQQLSLGHAMFDHLSSYTYPHLEALEHDKAKCDLFGTFVETEHKFLAASKEAIADIEQIALELDDLLIQQSHNIVTVTFTLLAVFTFALLLAGSFFITDSQRVRLIALRLKAIVVWNRLVHRNRVYDVGASHASNDVRITGVQDTRSSNSSKKFGQNFENCAAVYILGFMLVLLINAVCLHMFVVPSLIMGGPAFDEFEHVMTFLAAEMSPKLFLLDSFTYTSLGLFGFQCNSTHKPFFGITSPQKLVDAVNDQLDSFDATHQTWSVLVDEYPELKFGLDALRASGRPISDTFRDKIAPLTLAGNFSAAIALMESTLTDQFSLHESIAAEVSVVIDLLYANTLSLASYGRDTSLWFIYGISSMLFATVAFISSLMVRDASVYKLELSDVASDPSSALHRLIPKLAHVHEKQQAAMSQRGMMAIFALVTFIQILGIALPIRYLGDLVQQSPVANQVGRLDVLLVRDVYAARELFVNDDFSAMFMGGDLSGGSLERNNRNLLLAMHVLRYGGSWGISTGRRGSHDILGLWDNSQCLISDQHAAAKCADTSRPLHVSRMQGLGSLLSSIINGIAQVPDMLEARPSNTSAADRVLFVSRDPELSFLDSNVHDDARQGIATLSSMEANATIMQSMLSELRVLFGLNVAVSVIVLYYATFLRTVGNVVQQARLSRIFLSTIPLEAVSKVQAERLRSLFFPNSQEDF